MTVGTNALLEGKGARTSLVATEGFGDVLELRRQTRAHLYRLDVHHPPPLVPHERAHEVAERCGPDGVLTPLDRGLAWSGPWRPCGPTAPRPWPSGSCSRSPTRQHEAAVAAALRAALPGRARERLERGAARDPRVRAHLDDGRGRLPHAGAARLPRSASAERAAAAGLPAPAIMQSSGGVLPIADSAEHAAWTVMSGPAGGVIGAARLAGRRGRRLALTFDMGGTSCDVALVRDGAPARTSATVIAGPPAAPADARRRDRLGRRRQHRLGRLGRRPARGPALGGRAARPGRLRARRRASRR